MPYRIEFIREAAQDYRELDGSLKAMVDKKLEELSSNPFLGARLGNKFTIDLSGYFKTYVNSKRHRIMYRLITPENIEIVEIGGMGKRDKEEIFRVIGKRMQKRK
ncbi:MAG: addiction module toxin RelE [Spirochaetota bacterium]